MQLRRRRCPLRPLPRSGVRRAANQRGLAVVDGKRLHRSFAALKAAEHAVEEPDIHEPVDALLETHGISGEREAHVDAPRP